MHPQIRHARFNIIVCSVTLGSTLAAYLALLATLGAHRARGAFGLLGILGLLGLGPALYRRRPGGPGVVMDERDLLIRERSNVLAWRVVWALLTMACLGPWLWVAIRSGLDAVEAPFIAPEVLPWALMIALAVHIMAWSMAVLRAYGHEERASDE